MHSDRKGLIILHNLGNIICFVLAHFECEPLFCKSNYLVMQVSYKQSLLNKGAKFNNPLTPVISALKFQSNTSIP